jgi:hypothetical protein
VPGAEITVIRLRASLALPSSTRAYARARPAATWSGMSTRPPTSPSRWRRLGVEDHVVDNVDRSAGAVASEVLRVAQWLP